MDLDRAARAAKVVGAVAVPIVLALGGYTVGEGTGRETGLEAGKAKREALRGKYEAKKDALSEASAAVVLLAAAYDREQGCQGDLDACRRECELGHEDFPAPASAGSPELAPSLPDVSASPPPNLPAKLLDKLPTSGQRGLGVPE